MGWLRSVSSAPIYTAALITSVSAPSKGHRRSQRDTNLHTGDFCDGENVGVKTHICKELNMLPYFLGVFQHDPFVGFVITETLLPTI